MMILDQMPPALTSVPVAPETTAIEAVFERLLSEIIGGVHPAGSRLPAERELARHVGASRPTLREALRRLSEWRLVEPRRGSGIVVRPYRDWSIEVLAAYLRHGRPAPGQPSVGRILIDMLAMRRGLLVQVLQMICPRIPKGSTHGARNAMARAWSVRDQIAYAREDFEVMRQLAEAAQFTPGLWMLNQFANIYLDAATTLRFVVRAPDDYVQVHTRFFDLIETGDAATGCTLMAEYFERHDEKLVAALQVIA